MKKKKSSRHLSRQQVKYIVFLRERGEIEFSSIAIMANRMGMFSLFLQQGRETASRLLGPTRALPRRAAGAPAAEWVAVRSADAQERPFWPSFLDIKAPRSTYDCSLLVMFTEILFAAMA